MRRGLALLSLVLSLPAAAAAQQTVVVDRIVVEKAARRLTAYSGDAEVAHFPVRLGREPVGAKRRQGDGRTPEGVYAITAHNAASAYHLSLRISYPTAEQRANARAAGYSAGGDIMIHGEPNDMTGIDPADLDSDWTEGCIALRNDEIEWLYSATEDGAVVEVRP